MCLKALKIQPNAFWQMTVSETFIMLDTINKLMSDEIDKPNKLSLTDYEKLKEKLKVNKDAK